MCFIVKAWTWLKTWRLRCISSRNGNNCSYTLAAKYGVNALSILTVSDHIFTGEETTSEERQTTFNEMIEIALDAAIQQ